LFELVSMYADYVKRGVRVYFIKEGKCFVLCREVDQTRDIDESNYYLGEPDECSWYADQCNAEELGLVDDIPEEYLFVAKPNCQHLMVIRYGLD
jgi:hypothetical protein